MASSVQDNTIRNIAFASSSNATSLPGVWTGIYVSAGKVNIGTVTGNTIGSGTDTGSISVTTSGTGGTTFGIGSTGNGTVVITNNTIGSIIFSGSDSAVSASLVGIQVTAGANTITGNAVGSAATANSLNAATTTVSSPGQQVTGILSTSSNSASITGNTVANLNNNFVGSHSSGQIRGIVTSAGKNIVTGNTVRNLSTTSRNTDTSNAASVIGISQSSTAAGQTVSMNVVHSLANATTLDSATSVFGIYYAGSTTAGLNLIARNLVHSLAIPSTSKSALLYGMYFNSGTFTAQNNRVRVGLDASGSSTAGRSWVIGLYDNGSTPGRNFYHNSVHVGGTQTFDTASTYAFRSSGTTNTRDFRNNIFVNTRNSSGDMPKYKQFAVGYGGSSANPAGLTANNNILLSSGTGGVIGLYNSERTTLAAWQAATGQDASSAVADPRFVNPTGDATTVDLHLHSSSPAANAGVFLAAVADDCDGDTRSSTTPDIGADELPTLFQLWAQANGVGNDPNSPGANGLANLLNFAFGLNPTAASRNELSHMGNVITPGGLTTQLLPGPPTAKFIRRSDYVAAGLTYNAQFSADLTTWETDNTTPTVLATDGVNEVAGLDYPLLSGGAQTRFFRLVVGLQ